MVSEKRNLADHLKLLCEKDEKNKKKRKRNKEIA